MTKRSRKRIILSVLIIIAVILLAVWIEKDNKALELNAVTVSSADIPASFSGYRIAHVSDLHNAEMGENNADLLDLLRECEPDMIAITGDIIDSRRTNTGVALDFVREAVKIAPCYYTNGNHESRVWNEYKAFEAELREIGVNVLRNETVELEANGEKITLLGLDDPSFATYDERNVGDPNMLTSLITTALSGNDYYVVLMAHRPEFFEVYESCGVDLVLSGHAHGGQIRLPFIGGLFSPGQGFFPKYTSGLYTKNETNMVVSRGIGNSRFPFRVANRPEVVLVELLSAGE